MKNIKDFIGFCIFTSLLLIGNCGFAQAAMHSIRKSSVKTQLEYGGQDIYDFRYFTVNEGFSRNTIFDICQDKRGFIWFGTWDGLYRYDGILLKLVYRPKSFTPQSNHIVYSVVVDEDEHIWMGTEDGVKIWDPIFQKLISIEDKIGKKTDADNSACTLHEDGNGKIWITLDKKRTYVCYKEEGKYALDVIPNLDNVHINDVCVDILGRILLATSKNGVLLAERNGEGKWDTKPLVEYDKYKDEDIRCIYQDSVYQHIWIGTRYALYKIDSKSHQVARKFQYKNQSTLFLQVVSNGEKIFAINSFGLFVYSLSEGKENWVTPAYSKEGSLNDRFVSCVSLDREGNLWLGTLYGGVNFLSVTNNTFAKYSEINQHLDGHVISCVMEDNFKNIWIGIEDGSIASWNRQTKTLNLLKSVAGKKIENVTCAFYDDNKVYLGANSKNVLVLELDRQNHNDIVDCNTYPISNVRTIAKGADGKLLLGTFSGVFDFDPKNKKYKKIDEVEGKVNYIDVQTNGDQWFATFNGLYHYSKTQNKWTRFSPQKGDSTSIVCNEITTVNAVGTSIYIGTEYNGLWMYHTVDKKFRAVAPSVLGNSIVFKIIDDCDNLWITTNRGLYVYNISTQKIKQYTSQDGLCSNQFKMNSGIKTSDGLFIFGSLNGINSFRPENLQHNTTIPNVNITDFYVFNKRVDVLDKGSVLRKSISYSDAITLSQKNNSFAFQFSSTSYSDTKKNKYQYKLEPLELEWQQTHNFGNMVNYTKLPVGEYVFHIRTFNGEGDWSEDKCLKVTIKPYWWLSVPMKCVYLLVVLSLMAYALFHYKKKKNEEVRLFMLQKEQELMRVNMEKEEEVYRSKMEFFTCMVHEIRTPLTLILGPLNSIKKKETVKVKDVTSDLQIIERNGKRLLSLVNQLMDFRKVEENAYQLNVYPVKISEVIKNTSSDFQFYNSSKYISFNLDLPDKDCWANVDNDAFVKILFNLLSNAVKFTKDRVQISLVRTDDGNFWKLVVKDNGRGISVADQQSIFQSFYQVQQNLPGDFVGTGIGLFVVRRLVEMQGGRIYVDSVLGEGTAFSVLVPYIDNVPDEVIQCQTAKEQDKQEDDVLENSMFSDYQTSARKKILVVEDNDEMREYIISLFSEDYLVEGSKNGKLALSAIDLGEFDLVITDLMMPEMDGITLCRNLKKNAATSHIPVIILTAKADESSEMEGFNSEADMYVIKPFSAEILQLRVKSILHNREHLREKFYRDPEITPDILCVNNADEDFMDKLDQLIEAKIEDSNIPIDDLAIHMNMSRAVFYKKVKGLTGLTPNDYIRTFRFKKAIALFKNGEDRVYEVCYRVGFSSPSYFTKRFIQQFGISPSEYIKSLSN